MAGPCGSFVVGATRFQALDHGFVPPSVEEKNSKYSVGGMLVLPAREDWSAMLSLIPNALKSLCSHSTKG